jgi:hypothetical protein
MAHAHSNVPVEFNDEMCLYEWKNRIAKLIRLYGHDALFRVTDDIGPEIVDIPPEAFTAPAITGDAIEDETLTCSEGEWRGLDPVITFEWFGVDPEDEVSSLGTGDELVLTSDEVGFTIYCEVTATTHFGTTTTTTASVGPVEAATP